ncbi:MAG TPA: PorV/PorQ family protein [Elusimicrobiales bacterium]|nr:PorV/PorQ family protein [Elusimicrobiales bacterium]
MSRETNRKKRNSPGIGPVRPGAFLRGLLPALLSLLLRPAFCAAAGFDGNSAGTSSAQFLKLATGARGVALGEAFSALSDDSSALDWNPAGLIKINRRSATLMHSPYLASTYLDFFSYAERAGEMGSWGMSVKYMNYGKITRTDTAGIETGNITPYEVALNVGFAAYITGFNKDPEERFVLGATGKVVRSELMSSDSTVSSDLGILFPYFFENRFQLAISAQNIMGTLRYDINKYPLPLILRLGSVTRMGDNFLMTADIVGPRDNTPFLAMGGEFSAAFSKNLSFALRAGGNTRALSDLKGLRNIALGGGFRYSSWSLDYSFSPFGDLGSVHRISAGLNY